MSQELTVEIRMHIDFLASLQDELEKFVFLFKLVEIIGTNLPMLLFFFIYKKKLQHIKRKNLPFI